MGNLNRHFASGRSIRRLLLAAVCSLALISAFCSVLIPGKPTGASTGVDHPTALSPITVTLSPSDLTVPLGQTFSMTVWIAAGAESLSAVQIVMQYDGEALDNTAISDGSTLPLVLARQVGGSSGALRYDAGIFGSEGVTGTFEVCTLHFSGIGLAKDSLVDFTTAGVYKGGSQLSVSTAGGLVTVNGAFAVFLPAIYQQ